MIIHAVVITSLLLFTPIAASAISDQHKEDVLSWANGHGDIQILEDTIKHLVDEDLIHVNTDTIHVRSNIPSWIATAAQSWGDGTITDGQFHLVLEYLANTGILISDISQSTNGAIVIVAQESSKNGEHQVDHHGEPVMGIGHPGVAIDGDTDTIYLTYGQRLDHKVQIYLTASRDGGNTWSSPIQVSTGENVVMPHANPAYVELGPDGKIYILYQNKLANESWIDAGFTFGFTTLHLVVSDDGGQTFLPPSLVYPATGPDNPRDVVRSKNFDSITVDDSGRVYITWLESQGQIDGKWPPTTVRSTFTDDDGATWADAQTVKSTVCECCATSTSATSDGAVYVLFRDILDNPDGGLTFRDLSMSGSDDGTSWSSAQRISDDRFEIDSCPHSTSTIAVDGQDNIHAAWWTLGGEMPGTYYSVTGDGGQTWQKPTLLEGNDWYPATQVKISIDANDRPVIIWNDRSTEHRTVKYAVLEDDGPVNVRSLGVGDGPWSDSNDGITALAWSSNGKIFFKSWHDSL